MALRILAVVCARNEQMHVAATVQYLVNQNIDVVLIDNDSEDETIAVVAPYLAAGKLRIKRMPWNGCFSLTEQLRLKRKVMESSDTDWVMHIDADEWLQAPPSFTSLRAAIEAVDAAGYNSINFDEFTFVPRQDENFEHPDYRRDMRHYYFFEPKLNRLMRAWRKDSQLDNTAGAGHRLAGGDLHTYPENFILRHYIALSQQHVTRKYGARVFAAEDLAKGWHKNRLNIADERFAMRHPDRLKCLNDIAARNFDRTSPETKHFWEW